ncbi:classical arabinogalactan protein 9 [Triticum aestivum]|uniref:classical arabinogalactan protein 9 n=1 Tax=Triticum aestivum TaxID=4565 RepID=UPI001D0076ED|nr:classical arabinogalactan protein 9-like [Triticum aestivum]
MAARGSSPRRRLPAAPPPHLTLLRRPLTLLRRAPPVSLLRPPVSLLRPATRPSPYSARPVARPSPSSARRRPSDPLPPPSAKARSVASGPALPRIPCSEPDRLFPASPAVNRTGSSRRLQFSPTPDRLAHIDLDLDRLFNKKLI